MRKGEQTDIHSTSATVHLTASSRLPLLLLLLLLLPPLPLQPSPVSASTSSSPHPRCLSSHPLLCLFSRPLSPEPRLDVDQFAIVAPPPPPPPSLPAS